jgi:hypothetical protein
MPVEPNKIKKPSLVVANGVSYLAIPKEEDGKLQLQNAFPLGSPSSLEPVQLQQYLVAAYSEKLTDVNISSSSAWSSVPLSEDLDLDWQILILKLEQAIKNAPVDAVVNHFTRR